MKIEITSGDKTVRVSKLTILVYETIILGLILAVAFLLVRP